MLEKSDYQKDNDTSKEVELDTDGIQEQSIEVENNQKLNQMKVNLEKKLI